MDAEKTGHTVPKLAVPGGIESDIAVLSYHAAAQNS